MVTNKMGFVFKKNPVLKPKFKVTKHLHIIMCLYPIFWTFLKTAQTFYKYLVAFPVKYHAISSLGSKCFLCKKYCWLVRGSLFIELGCTRDLGKGWRGDLGTFMISRSI